MKTKSLGQNKKLRRYIIGKTMKNYNIVEWENFVYYDETSPSFLRWKISTANNKFSANRPAGSLNCGYYSLRIKYTAWLCHRVVWILHNGKIPDGAVIDHLDGNPLNNKINNLRLSTYRDNAQNQKKSTKNATGIVGVYKQITGGDEFYVAQWQDQLTGKRMRKLFSVKVHGNDLAFALAVEHRNTMIEEQTRAGAKYTARHGQ